MSLKSLISCWLLKSLFLFRDLSSSKKQYENTYDFRFLGAISWTCRTCSKRCARAAAPYCERARFALRSGGCVGRRLAAEWEWRWHRSRGRQPVSARFVISVTELPRHWFVEAGCRQSQRGDKLGMVPG